MRRFLLLAGVAVLSTGCASSPTTVNEVPVTVELRAGNRVELVRQGIVLRFDGVTNDSRCPMGALCIVAGKATLAFTFIGASTLPNRTLALDSDRPDSSLGVVLNVEELTPFRQINQPEPDPASYRLLLRISAK